MKIDVFVMAIRITLQKLQLPVDIFGTVVGESPDCLLLSGTVVGENPDYVCWAYIHSGKKTVWAAGDEAERHQTCKEQASQGTKLGMVAHGDIIVQAAWDT